MSDLLMNFANNQPRILTGLGQGIAGIGGQLIDQEVGKRKQEAYNTAMTNWEADGSKENLKNLYGAAQGMGILENTVQTIEAMDTLEQKNRLDQNVKVLASISSGRNDMALGYLNEELEALKADGTPEEVKGVQNFIDMINNGDAANVAKNLSIVTGIIPGGVDALDNIRAMGTEERAGESHIADMLKSGTDLVYGTQEHKNWMGTLGAQMSNPEFAKLLIEMGEIQRGSGDGMTEDQLFSATSRTKEKYNALVTPYKEIVHNTAVLHDLSNADTGFADTAMISLYNKIIDPESVVRESEAARTAASAGKWEELKILFEKLKNGQQLSEGARLKLLDASRLISKKAEEKVGAIKEEYRPIMEEFGLTEDSVFGRDAGENTDYEIFEFKDFILGKYPGEESEIQGKDLEWLKENYGKTYDSFLEGSKTTTPVTQTTKETVVAPVEGFEDMEDFD